MSTEFEREERYIVFKLSDVEEYFTPGEKQQLARLVEVQRAGREEDGKAPLECVVVESDWPALRVRISCPLRRPPMCCLAPAGMRTLRARGLRPRFARCRTRLQSLAGRLRPSPQDTHQSLRFRRR